MHDNDSTKLSYIIKDYQLLLVITNTVLMLLTLVSLC